MAYRTIRGKILYTSKKPERLDQERGREYFSITRQPDGTDVMHAHCEIDDEPMVVRDVVAAMDHRTAAPRDCHVRLSVGGEFEGSGWFRFSDELVPARHHVQMLPQTPREEDDERWRIACSGIDLYARHKPHLLSLLLSLGPAPLLARLKGASTSSMLCDVCDYLRKPDELLSFLDESKEQDAAARLPAYFIEFRWFLVDKWPNCL